MAHFDVLVETDAQKSKAMVSKLSFCSEQISNIFLYF